MPKEHRTPTEATAKHLYGNAINCAFRGCSAPLYTTYADGRQRTLNSRIAHIRARREGGPRWSDEMSEAENRSAPNLLLLCIPHADAVDQKELVNEYPVELLHKWKQAQITLYDKAVQQAADNETVGLQLTDEEATEVINKSASPSTHIKIYGDINNGGQGGVNGGAGGNGGVVNIGVGVVNGNATPGGSSALAVNNDGQPGRGFGGGGGGGGSSWTAPVPLPAREGLEGYGYGVLFSKDSLPAFGPASADRTVSDCLRVSALILVNFGEVEDALGKIQGAAWQNFTVAGELPVTRDFPVFAVLEAGGAPSGVYSVAFETVRPAGDTAGRRDMALVVQEPGELVRIPYALDVPTVVDSFGIWQVVVSTGGAQLASVDLMVKPPKTEND